MAGRRLAIEETQPQGESQQQTPLVEPQPAQETQEGQQAEESEETKQAPQPQLRCLGHTRVLVSPRPPTQRRGSRPPPRPQGPPLVTHLDLRAATAKQVQQLHFVEFEVWFPPRRDERAAEGFYTPLQEDFYNAYLNSGAIF